MPGGAVHDENLDLNGAHAEFIQPAGRRHRAPEALHPAPPLDRDRFKFDRSWSQSLHFIA
jgi:hypothetical protein